MAEAKRKVGMLMKKKDIELLVGAVDTHAHAMPSISEQVWGDDVFGLARRGEEAGMSAICVKNHYGSSAGASYLANKYAAQGRCRIVGGLTLNKAVGGWNPEAVRILAQDAHLGGWRCGRIVWFPSKDALGDAKMLRKPNLNDYLSPFRNQRIDDGLLPEVVEILQIIAEADLTLALSHTSPEESLALLPEARRLGVKKIMASHASAKSVGWTLEQKEEGAALGLIFEESVISWLPVMKVFGYGVCDPRRDIIAHMRAIGPEYYCLSSDCGNTQAPHPVEALRIFVRLLLDEGFSHEEVTMMSRTNANMLLGL